MTILKKKKEKQSKEQIEKKSSETWVNDLIQIDDNFVKNKEDEFVFIFKVEPISFNLLSENEQKIKIKSLSKLMAFIGDLSFGFYIKNKKMKNLDSHLSFLEEKIIKETNYYKKMIMNNEIKFILSLKKSKKINEKEYYLYVLSKNKERLNDLKETFESQKNIELKKLNRIEEIQYLCDYFDQEYIGGLNV